MEKTYPFSCQKHAHDIEYYRNHLYNKMHDMLNGEEPYDSKEFESLESFYYGPLEELYNAICFNTRDGVVSYLTGKQIALAKKIVFWAAERRANSLIKQGKFEFLKYVNQ